MVTSEGMPTTQRGPNASSIGGLLTLNSLSYTMPNDLSVTVSRTCTDQYFQSKDYAPGQTMVCVLNTGSAYVHPLRSYMRIDFSTTAAPPYALGEAQQPTYFRG